MDLLLEVYVNTLVKKAYDNGVDVIEYDGKPLLNLKENKSSRALQTDIPMPLQDYSNLFSQQSVQPSLPVPVPSEPPAMNLGLTIGGYDDVMTSGFSMQSQNVNLNASFQLDGTTFPLQNQLAGSFHEAQLPRNENVLALGPHQSSTFGFQTGGTTNLSSFRGVEEFFPEEEIRMRSPEILENEDMQDLLRILNIGGHGNATVNVIEDGFPYWSTYMPTPSLNYNFDEQTRSSGKTVVGWLKLKAALRWGIFIRKKAAERRAQLIELDDLQILSVQQS